MGILFYFYVDYTYEHFDAVHASSDFEPELSFISNPSFNHMICDQERYFKNIVMTYYALTTLTTVGFGDFYPVTNNERLLVVPIFFGGYIAFSLMQGNLFALFEKILQITEEHDESEELGKFLLQLRRFNMGCQYPKEQNIIRFFEHKWSTDKNIFV